MRKAAGWIQKHQITAFYILVFSIAWPAMIMMFYLSGANTGLQALSGLAATFSPVLVALLISYISHPGPKKDRRKSRWIVFILAWFISWVILTLHTWQIREVALDLKIILPTGIVALLPGWLISCACSRVPGVRNLFSTLFRPRGHLTWYLVALFIVPAFQLAGAGLSLMAGNEVNFELNRMSFTGALVYMGLVFGQGFLVSGGINEETGWRGFVLPRLQGEYPVIVAVVIVWFFWALWHIPYDIGSGIPIESILINRLVHNFIFALLMTWIYNRTDGSLLAPALFHPAMNTFGEILPRTDITLILLIILSTGVFLYERMWEKLPDDNKAVYS